MRSCVLSMFSCSGSSGATVFATVGAGALHPTSAGISNPIPGCAGRSPLRTGRTVVREGMNLVGVGLVVGAVAAFGAGRLIEGLLFGVPPHDGVTFVTVVAVLTATALAAIVIPAYRAARVDPIVTLGSE
jgi:hypothetical protein